MYVINTTASSLYLFVETYIFNVNCSRTSTVCCGVISNIITEIIQEFRNTVGIAQML